MHLDPRLTKALGGRYRVEGELGSGGMATVYQARDQRHDRSVAIKVLHPEVAASVDSARFLAEIHTTAQLSHPNILPLFDSGSDDGTLYYVMPLVLGESLRARLEREGTLETSEALRITREVADALGYAHANGVIHRDIKPENILLQSGHALVTDFGIARAPGLTRSDRLTGAGLSVGTPAYMSPEQASADPHVDGRADQYSLACVLFEMLTGEPPFAGPSVDSILVRRFTRPPPRATSRRPDIARHLDGALFKAMARDPNERFASIERFIEALRTPTRPWSAITGATESVAVLPFANMSGDPENEFFGDGMAEEITNALAKVPGLRVAARTSSFMFKGKSHDLRAIGEQLNVNAVLEGSVRRVGNRVRITAQLVSVNDGYQLWSERYDRELTDIFMIQDEIATAIAGRLAAALRNIEAKSLVKASTSSIEAYELYLRARALMKHRGTALLTATEHLERAVALDPEFAQAFAYLGQALVLSGFWGVLPPNQIANARRQLPRQRSSMIPTSLPGSRRARSWRRASSSMRIVRRRRGTARWSWTRQTPRRARCARRSISAIRVPRSMKPWTRCMRSSSGIRSARTRMHHSPSYSASRGGTMRRWLKRSGRASWTRARSWWYGVKSTRGRLAATRAIW